MARADTCVYFLLRSLCPTFSYTSQPGVLQWCDDLAKRSRQLCRHGGDLASIKSARQNSVVLQAARDVNPAVSGIWIGAKDLTSQVRLVCAVALYFGNVLP